MSREDRFTNTPEDAGRYDRDHFGHEEPYRPTRAELEADARDIDSVRHHMVQCRYGCEVWFHTEDTMAAQKHYRQHTFKGER